MNELVSTKWLFKNLNDKKLVILRLFMVFTKRK